VIDWFEKGLIPNYGQAPFFIGVDFVSPFQTDQA
jgi:hypothetical protein